MTPERIKELRTIESRNYSVDEHGNVWSSLNWRGLGKRMLMPHPNSHGYLTVKMKCGESMKKTFVHKLVCAKFHGPKPSPDHQVRHLNGVRTDNRASNLAWGTAKENAHDRKMHGTEKMTENAKRGALKRLGRRSPMCSRGHVRANGRCVTCQHYFSKGSYLLAKFELPLRSALASKGGAL